MSYINKGDSGSILYSNTPLEEACMMLERELLDNLHIGQAQISRLCKGITEDCQAGDWHSTAKRKESLVRCIRDLESELTEAVKSFIEELSAIDISLEDDAPIQRKEV